MDYNEEFCKSVNGFEQMVDRNILTYSGNEIGPYTRRLVNYLSQYMPLVDKNGKLYNRDGSEIVYREGSK